MAKANLSSLVHELRERIAASSSTPTPNNPSDDVVLEVRFRTVLPNLLHAYVLPSSTSSGTFFFFISIINVMLLSSTYHSSFSHSQCRQPERSHCCRQAYLSHRQKLPRSLLQRQALRRFPNHRANSSLLCATSLSVLPALLLLFLPLFSSHSSPYFQISPQHLLRSSRFSSRAASLRSQRCLPPVFRRFHVAHSRYYTTHKLQL